MGWFGDIVDWCGDRLEDAGEWVDDNIGGPIGDIVGGGLKIGGKSVSITGNILGVVEDHTIGGAENFISDKLSDAWTWASGRGEAEHELYVNYDKVQEVTDEMKSIATKKLGEAQDVIYEEFNKLNRVKGFQDYVGYVATEKYDQLFESLSQTIMNIATSIESKAEAIKKYEESSTLEKTFSTISMVFAKQAEGFGSIIESIGDGGIYLVGWVGGNVFGAQDFQKDCQTFIEKDLSHDALSFYYNSDFAKASLITEDSKAAGALKLYGQAVSMMAVGPVGRSMSGFGKGVEAGLNAGMTYNEAFVNGVKTATVQGILGNAVFSGVIGMGAASAAGDLVASMGKPSQQSVPIEQVQDDSDNSTSTDVNSSYNNVSGGSTGGGQVQYRNTGSGGGNGYVAPKDEITDITKPDIDIGEDIKIEKDDDVVDDSIKDNTDNNNKEDNNIDNQNKDNDNNDDNDSNNKDNNDNDNNNGYTVYVDPNGNNDNNVYYREDHTGMEYNGGNGPIEELPEELDNSDTLADLDTLGFDTDLDEIVKGNRYTKIPVSQKPVSSTKTSGSSSVVPIAAGLTVASAAGLGAKAYMDYKKNNSDFDDEIDSESDEEDEEENNEIENEDTSREEELKENMSDYYQNDSVYTARDSLEEV